MTIYFISGSVNASNIYDITNTSVGPFTDTDPIAMKAFMQRIDTIDVEYYIVNHLPEIGTADANCYKWEVAQHYDFRLRSSARLKLTFDKVPCDKREIYNFQRYSFLPFLVIFLAITSGWMHIKYLFDLGKRYDRLRYYYKKQRVS